MSGSGQSIKLLVSLVIVIGLARPVAPGRCQPTDGKAKTAPAAAVALSAENETITLTGIMQRATKLTGAALELKKNLAGLPDLKSLREELVKLQSELAQLEPRVSRLEGMATYDYDQLVDLEAALRTGRAAMETVIRPLGKAVAVLESAKEKFSKEKISWQTLHELLPEDLPLDSVQPVFDKAQMDIAEVLRLVDWNLGPIIELQQKAVATSGRMQELSAKGERMLAVVRSEIFSRVSPSMFSSQYYRALRPSLWRDMQSNLGRIAWPGSRFMARWGWVCFLQGLLSLVAVALLVRNRNRLLLEERWAYLAQRPISAALLLGVVAGWPMYQAVPFSWRFLLWAVIAIATARLLSARLGNRSRARVVDLLAALLVLTELARVLRVPEPIFRLFIFLLTAGGLPYCVRQLRQRGEWPRIRTLWPYALGALICGVIFVSELGGYSNLSGHVLTSSLKTIFLLLVAWLLLDLLQHGVERLLEGDAFGKVAILSRYSEVIRLRSRRIVTLAVSLLVFSLVLVIWKFSENPMDALSGLAALGVHIGGYRITLGLGLTAGLVLYGSFLLSWMVQSLLLEEALAKAQLQKGVQLSMARLVHYGLITFGFLFALGALGLDLRNITIIGGALSVGIGFGLQTIVNNFVCGLILLFERPIKVGDYIELNGQWAEIKDIGLRATTVQTFDRADIMVPNSDLISNQVINWTRSDRLARLKARVGVAYGSDVTRVMQILLECVADHREIMRSPEPRVYFMGFGDSSLDFELRFHVKDIDQWYPVTSDVHRAIDQRFRDAGIEIPFPQRDLHFRQEPPAPGRRGDGGEDA